MTVPPFVVVAAMTLCAFAGGLALKQFSLTRDLLWLVAGFCVYGLSNVFFVLVIDATGIARAIVLGGAAQILLTTAAGYWFGEKLTVFHIIAAGLVCVASALASFSSAD